MDSGTSTANERGDIIRRLRDRGWRWRHWRRAGCRELERPYGIPFRCLLPKDATDVLIASMAAGFTAEVATSCRLSRTMMQIGQAAGTAAALGIRGGTAARDVDPVELRDALREQHVQLDWPMSRELEAYLLDEETR